MKKLMIGLVAFTSISAFADEIVQISKKTGASLVTSVNCDDTREGVKLIVITCNQHSQYKANTHVDEDGKLTITPLESPRTVFIKSKTTQLFPDEPGSSRYCGVMAQGLSMEAASDRQGRQMTSPDAYQEMKTACGIN